MYNTRSRKGLLLTFWLLTASCFVCSPLLAAQSESAKKVPTAITASRMDYDANAQIVRFSDKVHVKRPDFEIWADSMTVYLDSSRKGQGDDSNVGAGMEAGDIDRIVALGHVRLKSEDKEGTSDKATYFAKEDRFLMEGSPVLKDSKQSVITGGRIVHYFSTNRSEVLDNVGVVFWAPDKTEGGKKPSLVEGLKP